MKLNYCCQLMVAGTQPQLAAGIAGRGAALLLMLLDVAATVARGGEQAADTVSHRAGAALGQSGLPSCGLCVQAQEELHAARQGTQGQRLYRWVHGIPTPHDPAGARVPYSF